MEPTKTPVEISADPNAGGQPAVKTNDDASAAASAENADLLPALEAALTTIDHLTQERNNYRTVALATKRADGKVTLTEDEIDQKANERAEEISRNRASDAAIKTAREELEKRIKAEKENRELRAALKNRAGVSNTPTGGAQNDRNLSNPGSNFFSAEQVAAIKEIEKNLPKGVKLDPKKIEEMHKKRMGR